MDMHSLNFNLCILWLDTQTNIKLHLKCDVKRHLWSIKMIYVEVFKMISLTTRLLMLTKLAIRFMSRISKTWNADFSQTLHRHESKWDVNTVDDFHSSPVVRS